jgi:hypothetical protein
VRKEYNMKIVHTGENRAVRREYSEKRTQCEEKRREQVREKRIL